MHKELLKSTVNAVDVSPSVSSLNQQVQVPIRQAAAPSGGNLHAAYSSTAAAAAAASRAEMNGTTRSKQRFSKKRLRQHANKQSKSNLTRNAHGRPNSEARSHSVKSPKHQRALVYSATKRAM